MPSPFSDKERELMRQIRDAESSLVGDQNSADDWSKRTITAQKTVDEYAHYRDGYLKNVKDKLEVLSRLREDLRVILINGDEPAPVPESKPVVEDCIDQLESRSKVEAPHARHKAKRSTRQRRSSKRHSS